MKKLILLCGPNGVGKTSTGQEMVRRRSHTAYVDTDPLRVMNPFELTDETIPTVARNISDVIKNYLSCPLIDATVFSYGLHGRRREVLSAVLDNLSGVEFRFLPLLLWCGDRENLRRLRADGRDPARIRRALANSRLVYADVTWPRLDTEEMPVEAVAEWVIRWMEENCRRCPT